MSEPSSAIPRPVPPSADDIARTSASLADHGSEVTR